MKNNYFKKWLPIFVFFIVGPTVFGQIDITPTNSPFIYQQNFNTYTGNSADTGIPGWTVSNTTNSYKGTGNGSSNAGGAWSFGTGGDWSLGGLYSGNGGITTYSVTFKNTTGTTITGLNISYDLEGWRDGGGNNAGMEVIVTGLPTSVGTSLSNNFPTAGNNPKLINKAVNLTNLTIANDETFTITWKNSNAAGSDNGVSVDNFRLEAIFTVATPTITPSVTAIADFGNVIVGTQSPSASFTFSAADLGSNDVSIATPSAFEISEDNTNWYAGTDVSPISGIITDKQIWVRFSPTSTGEKAGNITLSSNGATDQTIAVSGTGINGILLTPNATTLSYTQGQGPSVGFQFTQLTTLGLMPTMGDLTFATTEATSNFEVSADNVEWGNTALYTYASSDNDIANPSLYIRLKAGLLQGNVDSEVWTITGGGFTTSISVSGIVTPSSLETPIATPATLPTISGFVANWEAVSGATEYLLDVSLSDTFSPLLENYNSISVTALSKSVTGLLSGTTYYYRVRAKANAVVSAYSNVIEVKTSCDPVAVPIAVGQEFCASATVASLSATVLTDATANWYNNATAETPLESTAILTTQSYFVSQTTANGCESPRTEVAVLIKQLPEMLTAVAQNFCESGTIADLEPAQQIAQPTQITETFEDANWASHLNYSGNYLLTTGNWTAEYVNRISTGSSDPYKRLSLSNASGTTRASYMISPVFEGVQSVTIEATATINANRLEVSKIVNGVETVIQTLNVGTTSNLTMQTFTVNVNEPNDVQIKVSGKPVSGFNYYVVLGTMVFTTYQTALPTIGWYDVASGGSALAATTNLQSGTYFVSQTVNGCESLRTAVSVSVAPRAIPDFPAISLCLGSEAPLLASTSPNGVVGTWSPAEIDATTSGSYVFTPNAGICAVSQTIGVSVVSSVTPTFEAVAPICSGSTPSELPVTSTNGITGSWTPALNTSATTEYTFTPNSGQCAETLTLIIEVTPQLVSAFDAVAPICSGSTPSELSLTSTNGITGTWTPALNTSATTEYTFTPNSGQCAETQTLTIEVIVFEKPTGNEIQDFEQGDTLADFDVTGNGIVWYDAPTGGNILPETTVIESGVVYYASQASESGCESEERLKIIAGTELGTIDYHSQQLQYYPNPVNDMLTIAFSEAIDSVSIYTMTGQLIYQKQSNDRQMTTDMRSFAAGTYVVKVTCADFSKNIRIVKK